VLTKRISFAKDKENRHPFPKEIPLCETRPALRRHDRRPLFPAVEAGGFVYYFRSNTHRPGDGKDGNGAASPSRRANACVIHSTYLRPPLLTGDDVVKVTVYLVDLSHFPAMNEVYASEFSEPYPARTTVGVRELPLGASVEIEMGSAKGVGMDYVEHKRRGVSVVEVVADGVIVASAQVLLDIHIRLLGGRRSSCARKT
jgi:2-iminobutanoate/2-iminopropanoate deaminase